MKTSKTYTAETPIFIYVSTFNRLHFELYVDSEETATEAINTWMEFGYKFEDIQVINAAT